MPMYSRCQSKISTDLSSLSLRLNSLSLSLALPLLRAPPSLPHAAPPSLPRGDGRDLPLLRVAAPSGGARRCTPLFSARRHSAAHPRVAGVLGRDLPAVARGSVPSSSAGSRAGARPPPPAPAARGTLSPPPSGGTVAELGAVARWRGLPSSSSGGGTWWRGPLHLLSSGALLEAA